MSSALTMNASMLAWTMTPSTSCLDEFPRETLEGGPPRLEAIAIRLETFSIRKYLEGGAPVGTWPLKLPIRGHGVGTWWDDREL